MDTLLEDKYMFLIISRSVLLRMRNIPDKMQNYFPTDAHNVKKRRVIKIF